MWYIIINNTTYEYPKDVWTLTEAWADAWADALAQ